MGLAGVGWRDGEKMQTIVTELKIIIIINKIKTFLDFIYLSLERGEGGRKRRREISIGCLLHTLNQGPGLQPGHVT